MKDLPTGTTFLQGATKIGVYEWSRSSSKTKPVIAFSSIKAPVYQWHHRLGHPSSTIPSHLISHKALPMSSSIVSSFLCNSCHCNKTHKLPFSSSSLTSSRLLELLYSDVWTSHVVSHDGYKYYVISVAHHTRSIWLYCLEQNPTFMIFSSALKPWWKTFSKFHCYSLH